MKQYTGTSKLTFQDLIFLLEVGAGTAKKYLRDIKDQYKIPIVLYCHFKLYFNC